jgi:CHAT domain-containing protein
MVLGPAASLLGSKRLVIVAEGQLQSVPFTALPALDGAGGTADEGKETAPLMVEHEIVGISSATALLVLREKLKARPPASRKLAVLADPVFEKDDPRFFTSRKGRAANVLAARGRGLDRLVGLTGKGRRNGLARLDYASREAEAVLSYVSAGERMLALGFDANKTLATSPELGKFRFIHFATHGFYNEKHPELSGIMLSMFDESRRSQNGFLQLHEVYNLKLPAELVVLSACQTGVGKEIRGEGAIGLSRGFIHAGAARVMGSLWKVDDEATMELMNLFYKKMLASSRTPAAALRDAQIEMWKDRRWRSPYHWAGFVLQGEWK